MKRTAADAAADRLTNFASASGGRHSKYATAAGFLWSLKMTLESWSALPKGRPTMVECPGYLGELNKIYVLRRVHRQGIGSLLLCAVARRFLDRGIGSMLLFGEAPSPSNGFYELFGAERLYSPAGEFHGGYGWRDLNVPDRPVW